MQFKYKTKPYAHQEEALQKSHNKKNFAYFMEMGCGKSKVLIDNIYWLWQQKEIDTAIVVAPKGVYMNWKNNEIPIHLPDDIDADIYLWKASSTKNEKKKLSEGVTKRDKFRILLMNVESFVTKKAPVFLESFTHRSEFLLAIDESTTIKNVKAKRTKSIMKFGETAKYKRILTGSPITQSPLDLYSQCAFLSKSLLGYDSYWSFQGRFAIIKQQRMGSMSFNQVVGYKNLEELTQKLKFFAHRTTKKEALDLPDKIYTTRQVELTSTQIDQYISMKKTSVIYLEDGNMVSAPEVMTRLLRLQQLLCGYLVNDDGETIELANNRIKVMMEVIEEMDGKVIIWSRFRYDIKKIKNELAKAYGSGSVVTYYGDTSQEDRDSAIHNFQTNPETRFFVSNAQTGGRGITLTAASNVIYYSNDFNLESRKQSEDRCHRIGQHKPVLYVDLVCPNTVDVHIVKSLLQKDKIANKTLGEEVLEWLKV
jgi:SNF2 family DNA or RNA helicase